jgi:MFS family permease
LRRRLPNALVAKFYLYRALLAQGFITPIVAEFVLSRGLSLSELGALGATFMATWTLGEVPTGYVADRIGRRNSLVASSALTALSILAFAYADSFAVFAAIYVAWAIGVTFRSGTGSAWLYEMLAERLDESRYAHVRGRGRAIWLAVTAGTSVVGAHLAELDWTYPFLVNAAVVAAGILVLLTFPEPAAADDGDPLTPLRALRVVREEFTRPPLRSFVVYTSLFFGLVEVAREFTQPAATSVGVSVAELGWLYAGFNLVAAGATAYAGAVADRIGVRRWFVVAPPVVGVALLALAAVPALTVPALFLLRAANDLTQPLKGQYLNDHVAGVGRATVLSAASMTGALAAVASRVAGGVVADATSSVTMFAVFGGGFVVLAAAILAVEPPVPATSGPAPTSDD